MIYHYHSVVKKDINGNTIDISTHGLIGLDEATEESLKQLYDSIRETVAEKCKENGVIVAIKDIGITSLSRLD